MGDVDICIGFNEDESKPDQSVIELAVNHFEDMGYKVRVNYPYSRSETPACDFPYHSLILEINKRAYLRSGTIDLIDNRLHDVIRAFMGQLLA